MPVNPEAIGVFGLFVAVVCFGLEQLGVGVKGADHEKMTRSLAYLAIFFGGLTQIFTSICIYLFDLVKGNSIFLGTVFGFFGMFWVVVGIFFLKGGDKKVMAHFFGCSLVLTLMFTYIAFQKGLILPLGVDLILIDLLLLTLIPAWYTGKQIYTKIAGGLNIAIGIVSLPLLFSALGIPLWK